MNHIKQEMIGGDIKMDATLMGEMVTGLGFPIALSIGFCTMFFKMYGWMRTDFKEREDKNREQFKHLSEIIDTNSKALLKNSEVMEKINSNIHEISANVHKLQSDVTIIKIRQEEKDR